MSASSAEGGSGTGTGGCTGRAGSARLRHDDDGACFVIDLVG